MFGVQGTVPGYLPSRRRNSDHVSLLDVNQTSVLGPLRPRLGGPGSPRVWGTRGYTTRGFPSVYKPHPRLSPLSSPRCECVFRRRNPGKDPPSSARIGQAACQSNSQTRTLTLTIILNITLNPNHNHNPIRGMRLTNVSLIYITI